MARRRAAGLLLALAACIATATAAPTASNHTSLDLYDGAPDGCYYNFQHYGEGDRIMTNEPCLNCTCHNRMLMCYLKVCPFTKPIGQDCTIEKRADQCCPIVTCPDVPVDLLTSTTTSPAEYGPTGIGKLDKFGCSINGKYFSEGSKVPPAPNKPCEHCYCIRNMTTCVMQECTLHVDGCTPIYHKDVCCPVRYSCDHPEDEMPLLDDLSTTVRPTPGFLLTTTTVSPVTQMSQDCVYENQVYPDGALIRTEKACDHCYCMKGDIVCVVQECGTPMENEGKNCTALRPREGVCCPDTYICEGDESTTGTFEAYDHTTVTVQEELTTLSPPRRTNSEGSGYRNEPDELPYTELPGFAPEMEGSGEEEESKLPTEIIPDSATSGLVDEILSITEEPHEYIPLTTTKPSGLPETTTVEVENDDNKATNIDVSKESSESQSNITSTTGAYTVKESDETVTSVPQSHAIESNEPGENIMFKPHDETAPVTTISPIIEDHEATTVTFGTPERDSSEPEENMFKPHDETAPVTTISPIIEDHEATTVTFGTPERDSSEPEENMFKPTDETAPVTTIAPIIEDHEATTVTFGTPERDSSEPEENMFKPTDETAPVTTIAPIIEDHEATTVTYGTPERDSSELEENMLKPHDEMAPVTTIAPIIEDHEATTVTFGIPERDSSEPEKNMFKPHDETAPVTTITPIIQDHEATTVTFGVPERDSSKPEENMFKPHDETAPVTTIAPIIEDHEATTVTFEIPERDSSESQTPVPSAPTTDYEKPSIPNEEDLISSDIDGKATTRASIDVGITSISAEESSETTKAPESSPTTIVEGVDSFKSSEQPSLATTVSSVIGSDVKETTETEEPNIVLSVTDHDVVGGDIEPVHHITSSGAPSLEDEYITTELQEQDVVTESSKVTDISEPHKHVTASTPMLEEIEKDTTEYTETENIPNNINQDDTSKLFSTTMPSIYLLEKDTTKPSIAVEHNTPEGNILDTSGIYDQHEISTTETHKIPEHPTETNIEETIDAQKYSPTPSTSTLGNEKGTTVSDEKIQTVMTQDDTKLHDFIQTTIASPLESEIGTTEPDKGLNTIPSGVLEEEISVPHDAQTTTNVDENPTTDSELDDRYSDDNSSKQTTAAYITIAHSEESSILTTESAFRKEDSQPSTEEQARPELTTVADDVTKDVTSTLTQDDVKSTESALDLQKENTSTSKPNYTETVEETTLRTKDGTFTPSYESSTSMHTVSEKDSTSDQETATTASIEQLPETTAANQEENEIFNEPRIPGEGDCLLNGITYANESSVPSSNKCQSGCKCISSIVKCDPILCSLPPDMDNCETIYDSPDSCCPTYVCDHKSETYPPQSHSQMSGTESPVALPVDCHGDECVITGDQKYHAKPSIDCKSGVCPTQTDEAHGQETDSSAHIPEKSITDQNLICSGHNCEPVLCTDENGCQAMPVKPCEGEKCDIPPISRPQETQPCAEGSDCNVLNVPTKDCSAGDCVATETQLGDIHATEICTDKEGCHNIPETGVATSDQHTSEQCPGPNCKQTQIYVETSTKPIFTLQEDAEKDTVKISETTDKLETTPKPLEHEDKPETSKLPTSDETLEKQPELEPEKYLTTSNDQNEIVTKADLDIHIKDVTTTQSSNAFTEEEYTTEEPETKIPEYNEEHEMSLPASTGTTLEEYGTKLPILEEITSEQPDTYFTSKEYDTHKIKTEQPDILSVEISTKEPQETDMMVSITPEVTANEEMTTKSADSSTEPSKPISDLHEQTLGKVEPSYVGPEEITEPPTTYSSESYTLSDITNPSDENIKENTEESTREPSKPYDKEPQAVTDSAIEPIERGTEPPQDITELPIIISHEEKTQTPQHENITETPKLSTELAPEDSIKEIQPESGTEPTKIIDTDDQEVAVDQKETTSIPSEVSVTEISTPADNTQKVTEFTRPIEKESTAITESEESPVKESHEVTEDTEHKDTEETSTEALITHVTDSKEIIKSPEKTTDKDTTLNILEEDATKPSMSYTTKLDEITKSPLDLHEDMTTKTTDDSNTPKEETLEISTESSKINDIVTESPGTQPSINIDYDNATIKTSEDSVTEPPKSIESLPEDVQISPGEDEREDTTLISYETATDPTKTFGTEPQEDSSLTMVTESATKSPQIIVTDAQEISKVPDETGQEATTSRVEEERVTETPETYTTEKKEITKSPEEIDHEDSTSKSEETVTDTSKLSETEPIEDSITSEQEHQKDTTSQLPKESSTELPNTEITDIREIPQSTEIIQSGETTIKVIESATEPSKTSETVTVQLDLDTESPTQSVSETENEIDNLKPTAIETEKPEEDEDNMHKVSESPEINTTTQDFVTTELAEPTTPTLTLDSSRRTESGPLKPEETKTETPYTPESLPPQSDLSSTTEMSIKDHITTTSAGLEKDIETTIAPIAIDSEKHEESSSGEPEIKIPQHFEIHHTTLKPVAGETGELLPNLQEAISTEIPDHSTVEEEEISAPIEYQTKAPSVVIQTDDLKTTSSEIQHITTLKPTENVNEYPINYTPEYVDTVSQELSTEKISIGTEKPEEPLKTVTPATATEVILPTISESGTETSPLGTDKPSEENPVEEPEKEPEDKYSTEKSTAVYETTKLDLDEMVTTASPVMHKTEEPIKVIDNIEDSLVTEKQYESSTEPSDLEKESHTQLPIQESSAEPESDITQSLGQGNLEENLTSSSGELPQTTEKSESATSEKYAEPSGDKIGTEPPSSDHKTTINDTGHKDHLPEEDASLEPEVPEQQVPEIVATVSGEGFTTGSPTILPSVDITTESIAIDSSNADNQEPVTKDQGSVQDIQTISTEPSPTTVSSETKVTVTEDHIATLEPDQEVPESNTEFISKTTLSPKQPSTGLEAIKTEQQTSVTEEHHTASIDQITTEVPESIKKEPLFTTTENAETLAEFEPTTIPKQELPMSTSSPLEDADHIVKEGDVGTVAGEEHTTEKERVPDSSDISQPSEAYTEKQPETIHTDTPEKEISIEEHTTTRQPHEPEVYQTTSLYEKSTESSVSFEEGSTTKVLGTSSEEESTTPVHDIPPTVEPTRAEQEQSIPVIVSDLSNIPPKESDTVQTEKATDKPLQETAGPEEEFILATSKAPTTMKAEEEEISTPSQSIETTAKSTEKPPKPMATTAPEVPKPISTEVQPTDEVPIPDEEGSFPPSGTSGYGQEPPDYMEEDQTFGPGTCRYGGKVYVSAQQIPRDDPCDFCFCFRSDIICLQQSCPPPIHGCHEEPIQGFCCPRYECPVSMATTVNVTTTTTTTTTTLPPHFPTHSYKGSAQRRGCQIKGQTYKVGEVVRASSGPCLHCTCGGDGQMKCDPKVCTPEPMLRQMIAAAVSAKRRR